MQINDDLPYIDETNSATSPASPEVKNEETKAESGTAPVEKSEDEDDNLDGLDENIQKRIQKRIDKATAKLRSTERERDALRAQIEMASTQKPAEPARPKPTLESCDFDQERLIDELTEWKIAERERTSVERQKTEQQTQKSRELDAQFLARKAEVVAEFPDYDAVAFNKDVSVTEYMATAVKNEAEGARVLYFLGLNPDVALKISRLTPTQQFQAIAELNDKIIELRQAEPVVEATQTNVVKPSTAPEPPITIQSRGKGVVKDPESMTTDEWMAWRNAQLRKK